MSADPFHDRLLEMVLRLPGAYEDRPWGSVHCKVDGKIFVGWGQEETFEKAEKGAKEFLEERNRFTHTLASSACD